MSRLWPLLAAAAALVPFAGAFSTTHAFYVRDLALYFWPRHLWLRQTVARGDWPWWDPHPAGGQSAVADALNNFFVVPATIVRLALPDVPGFNFWVAAPFPLAAVGMWMWLRRHVSAPAAAVGAAVFAAAGPVLSAGNFPNLSWAVACIPWALWSADRLLERPGAGRVTMLAGWTAMQAVSGEPVTLAGTGALLLAYAAFAEPAASWKVRVSRTLRIGTGLAAGTLLAAVQLAPLGWAAMHSPRGADVNTAFWSMHPLELLGTVVSHVFGHPYSGKPATMPWIVAFHQREPLFASLYVGLGALTLALLPPRDEPSRRRRVFWWAAAGIGLLCALGEHTPVYPAIQAALPVLESLRYPVKYSVVCVVALAALAAGGAEVLLAQARGQAAMRRPVAAFVVVGAIAALAALAGVAGLATPGAMQAAWRALADGLGLVNPLAAAEWIVRASPGLFVAAAALGGGLLLLLAVSWTRHRAAAAAAMTLCVVAVVDPLATNRDLHPTMPAAEFGPPSWAAAARRHPGDRVYVGGRVLRTVRPPQLGGAGLDVPGAFTGNAEVPFTEANALLGAEFAYVTSPWGVREPISLDLPALFPREYFAMLEIFREAAPADRFRFLRRVGVRYCFVAAPPDERARPVAPPNPWTQPMALYECGTDPRRAYVTPRARVVTSLRDQIEPLFDAAHDPYGAVLLEREPPPPAGRPGPPAAPHARIVSERNTELVVGASAGGDGGYLNLADTYDPAWRVEVDGEPATLLRANGLYRAVRLAPGPHEVRFRYRPIAFAAGLAVTLVTALVLLAACVREWLTARGAARRMRLAATAS